MEIIIGKYDQGFLRCLLPFRTLTAIKIRIRTDTTFCRRDIELIGVNGVRSVIFIFFEIIMGVG